MKMKKKTFERRCEMYGGGTEMKITVNTFLLKVKFSSKKCLLVILFIFNVCLYRKLREMFWKQDLG